MLAAHFAISQSNREAKPNGYNTTCLHFPLLHVRIFSRPQLNVDLAFLTNRVNCILASQRRISSFSGQFRIAGATPRDAFLPIRTRCPTTSPSRLFRTTSAFHAQIMFTKAIQQQQPAPVAKQHSLSQTLLSSSSPLSRPDLHSNGSRSKQAQLDRSPISNVNPVLKPSASSVLNGPSLARTFGASNLGKRTLSQTKDLESAFSNQNAFHGLGYPDPFSKSQSQLSTPEQATNLHEAVYFDENDFDDDADLDLEVEDPINKGHQSTSEASINLPVDQKTFSNDRGVTTSSAPLPWSSSPLQHKLMDPKPLPRPSRPRTIPWRTEGDNYVAQVAGSGPPADVQRIIDEHRANRAQRQQDNGEFTPRSKDDNRLQHPWTKTASAMKEEQKKLRQANKRLVKSNDAVDEDTKAAVKARNSKKLEAVFLSDEQKRVLKLVVESGKSVFFTGSAGMSSCQCNPSPCGHLERHRYWKVCSHARYNHFFKE